MVGWTSPDHQLGSGDGLDVLLQTETGALAPPVTYSVPHWGYDELDAGDIDGDGRTDLIVMSGQTGCGPNVSVLLQTADGALGAPTSYSVGANPAPAGSRSATPTATDAADIVVSYGGNRPSSFIARFLQNASGAMDPAVSYPSYDIPSALVARRHGRRRPEGRARRLTTAGIDSASTANTLSGDFVGEELYTISRRATTSRKGWPWATSTATAGPTR